MYINNKKLPWLIITHDIQKSIFILESKGALWKDYLNFVRTKNKKKANVNLKSSDLKYTENKN
jgi:hypothetical protein